MNLAPDEQVQALHTQRTALAARITELQRHVVAEHAIVTDGDHAQLSAWRRDDHDLLQQLLDLAPAEPTPWWPGAWRLLRPDGYCWHRGGAGNLGAWRTRTDADAALHHHRTRGRATLTWSRTTVTWTAADERRARLFDAEFWIRAPLLPRT